MALITVFFKLGALFMLSAFVLGFLCAWMHETFFEEKPKRQHRDSF
jgi:hypothetical protein